MSAWVGCVELQGDPAILNDAKINLVNDNAQEPHSDALGDVSQL
jgi:hypothetical protein